MTKPPIQRILAFVELADCHHPHVRLTFLVDGGQRDGLGQGFACIARLGELFRPERGQDRAQSAAQHCRRPA